MRTLPLALCLLLAGCVPSINPLYTEKELIFDAALVGQWNSVGYEGEGWVFEKSAGKEYRVRMYEKDRPDARMIGHLVALGEYRFLDLQPEKPGGLASFQSDYLMPLHSFYRVWLDGDRLKIGGLDLDWMREKLRNKELDVEHLMGADKEDLLLTASTPRLQALVLKYAADPKAFPPGENGSGFVRAKQAK